MIVGCLGDIIFEVSDNVIKTLRNVSYSGSARVSEHEIHLQKSLIEFCGTEPDEISFDITLSAYLGISPQTEIDNIAAYMESGTAVIFVLGTKKYGQYRWLIVNYKVKMDHHDKDGTLTSAEVSVSLKEYVKG